MAYLYIENKITSFAKLADMGGNGEFSSKTNGYGWKWGIFYKKNISWYGWICIWPNRVEWSGSRNFAPWMALSTVSIRYCQKCHSLQSGILEPYCMEHSFKIVFDISKYAHWPWCEMTSENPVFSTSRQWLISRLLVLLDLIWYLWIPYLMPYLLIACKVWYSNSEDW